MKYIVSWYKKDMLLPTNECKTFSNRENAIAFYHKQKANTTDLCKVSISITLKI